MATDKDTETEKALSSSIEGSGSASTPDAAPASPSSSPITATITATDKPADKDAEEDGPSPPAPEAAEAALRRALLRKYDARLMPTTFLTFLFFFLDKSNIAFARINGLESDLALSPDQFNTALALFFITNLLFNIPGNLALRRVGGGLWLPLLIVSWGLVTTFSGFIVDFVGLALTRVFLGLTESSFFGGVLIYLGFFYTQDELISRVGIFYSSTPLAGWIGGLLAAGLGQVRVDGYNGWPWIFFVEGLLTVALGVMAYFVLPNTPEDAAFLSPGERVLALQRMNAQDRRHYIGPSNDGNAAEAHGNSSNIETDAVDADTPGDTSTPPETSQDRLRPSTAKRAILNFMTLTMSLGAFFSIQGVFSYSFFLPTIVQTMGFDSALSASLMTVPPNMAGFIFTLAACFFSQRAQKTALPLNVCAGLGVLGYTLLLVGGRVGPPPTRILTGLQYAGTFFASMSVHAVPPLALTWMTVNARPHYVRAVALGFVLTVGNLSAFVAAFTYIRTEAPSYTRGHSINLGCHVGLLLIGIAVPLWMMRENRKRDRGERDYRLDQKRYAGFMSKEQYEFQLGWLHPSYRYKM